MRYVLALALAASLIAAGCGGDDDDEALTKQEFITQADQVCAEGQAEIGKEADKVFKGQPSKAETEKFTTETAIPNIQSQIDGVRALTPPEGDEDQVNEITDSAQAALDEMKQDPSLLTQRGGSDPFEKTDQLSKEYGLKKC